MTTQITYVSVDEFEQACAKTRATAITPRYATVRTWGCRVKAYADSTGIVRVYDPIAGYYTACHHLTPAQLRYVRSRTMPKIGLPAPAKG